MTSVYARQLAQGDHSKTNKQNMPKVVEPDEWVSTCLFRSLACQEDVITVAELSAHPKR